MTKRIFFFTNLLLISFFSKGQDLAVSSNSYQDSLKKTFDNFSKDLMEKQDSVNRAIKRIDSLYGLISKDTSLKKTSDKLKLVAEKVEILEKKEIDKQQIKFKICEKAISEMKDGSSIVSFVNDLLQLQQEINLTTNIWRDSVVRNGFDKAQSWTTIAGSSLAGISLLNSNWNSNDKLKVAGIGISITGLGSILKKAFGKENVNKFELIQLSRKSYDDLTQLNNVLQNFIRENEQFDTSLTQLETKFKLLNQNITNEKILENNQVKYFIIEVTDKMNSYNLILKQIPIYLAQLKGVMATYSLKYYDNDELKLVLKQIQEKAVKIENKYNTKIKPIIDIAPEIKSVLLSS